MHQINPGLCRQLLQFFFNIKSHMAASCLLFQNKLPLPTGSALRMKVNSLRVLCAPDGHSRVRTGHTEPAGCPMHSLQALPESGEPPDCSPVSPMLFCKYQLLLLISVFLFLHFMENLHKFLAGNGLLFNQKLRNLIEAFPVL